MSGLTFGAEAFVRKLQMSSCQLFAFVEGSLDRPFCERLLSQVTSKSAIKFQVIAAKELPGNTGGKVRLVTLYKELSTKRMLRRKAFGKPLTCAIFLDKDIDDLAKSSLRSPHVIYTSTYDLEGDLISCGDMVRATADACGLTVAQAQAILGNSSQWILNQAMNWLDWTTLCVISQLKQVNPGCTFSRVSDINSGITGPVDQTTLANYKVKLGEALGLSPKNFETIYKRYKKLIEGEIASGRPLKSFKGKWLLTILENEVTAKNTTPDAHLKAIGQIVAALLVGQVGNHQNCGCCETPALLVDKLLAHLA